MEFQINIPSEAAGRVIGIKGRNIKLMAETPGIIKLNLKENGLNNSILTIQAESQTAIDIVVKMVEEKLQVSKRILDNHSRKEHSWMVSKNGFVNTPDIVHKTGNKPIKGTQRYIKQKLKVKELQKLHSENKG